MLPLVLSVARDRIIEFGYSAGRNFSPSYILIVMDLIYIRDLKVNCIIGLWEWERRTQQTLHINVEMATDITAAAASDDIKDTLDYKAVSKRIVNYAADTEFQLVETLAENIASLLLDEFKVPWCRLQLNKKGALRDARDVGVIIERGSRPDA
ncbi:MAG: dihydroneopterin aldolase [Gammaproteobacteria bacterium]|nr:MAG: dihydroneopterin aldolase [Gammaproteobacteria bacterium]